MTADAFWACGAWALIATFSAFDSGLTDLSSF
jgi:hypothetical protein